MTILVKKTQQSSTFQTIVAEPDLCNLKTIDCRSSHNHWAVHFNNFIIYTNDMASLYIALKDIFLQRIYDFEAPGPCPIVIDGGGHIGLFTLFVKNKYPSARVTVFEPDTLSLSLMKKNFEANGIHDVCVIPSGLYKSDGTVSFGAAQSDGSSIFSPSKNVTIEVVKLSDYITSEIDFVKLNIEGAELDVITEIEPKLHLIKELVIEYHGFPEIGQTLHKILTIFDRTGFRYMIHDFDAETNYATKPPFRLNENKRFYLLIYAKRIFEQTYRAYGDLSQVMTAHPEKKDFTPPSVQSDRDKTKRTEIKCPHCTRRISVSHKGLWNCPFCRNKLFFSFQNEHIKASAAE